jgi:type 1 glutamine amidotransferase/nicotinamidase-related amidase
MQATAMLAAVLAGSAIAGALLLAAPSTAAEPDPARRIVVTVRRRAAGADGRIGIEQERLAWDAKKTAAIVCDMWDAHWCKGATRRVAEMAPRLNEMLSRARRKGVLIVHAPGECMEFYKDHPARRRAKGAAEAPGTPEFLAKWAAKLASEEGAEWPIDQSGGGCDCEPECKQGLPWRRQIDAIEIKDEDAITDSGTEVWNLLAARGIDNVIVTGVHANMCVIGRPFGLRNLARAGKTVVLVRDLTDTMYDSRKRPFVPHFTGTDRVVAYIERHVCPTISSADITGKAPFRFSKDDRPRVVFLIGEREYATRSTLPAFARDCLEPEGLGCAFVCALSNSDKGSKHDFPGFGTVKAADLVFVSVRRRGLEMGQLDLLRAHLDAGKPLVGIRTASHAFHTRGRHPKGHAEWREFDPQVLGGNYHGHHGHKHKTEVTIAPRTQGAKGHPILTGVGPFTSPSWLYKVRPLGEGTTPLLVGTIPDAEAEPVAWTNTHGKARVFYTSLGHAGDFERPEFARLMTNAVLWALGKPVPKERARSTRKQ